MPEEQAIKKVVVKKESLPSFQFTKIYNTEESRFEIDSLYYKFRYRIISEDKNRISFWSPIEKIEIDSLKPPFPYTSLNRISIAKSENSEIIAVLWSAPVDSEEPSEYEKTQNSINRYDVWIRWNNNDTANLNDSGWQPWELATTISSTSFSVLKRDEDVKRLEVAVQIPTTEKIRDYNNNKVTLFRGLSGTI